MTADERIIAKELEPAPRPAGRSRAGIGRRVWPKLCFERAGLYQMRQPDVTLVHAVIDQGAAGLEFIHAWCELPEGLVFDGVDNAFYLTDAYRAHVHVLAERRYDAKAAAQAMTAHEPMLWAAWEEAALQREASGGRR